MSAGGGIWKGKNMKNLLNKKVIGVFIVAAFILGSTAILGFAMSTAQGSMDKEVVTRKIPGSDGVEGEEILIFPVNENGQTFGSGGYGADNPDLVLAYGIDGTLGYVLRTDIDGTGPLEKPNNPDEALAYMEELDKLAAEARARGESYIYTIPLYASDGRTVIGEFGVGNSGAHTGAENPDPQYSDTPTPASAEAGAENTNAQPPGGSMEASAEHPNAQPPAGSDQTTLDPSSAPQIQTQGVQSVAITYYGRQLTDVSMDVGDRIPLMLSIEPLGVEEGLTQVWTSSDLNIFKIEDTNLKGVDAVITGISSGVATLTVSVGGVIAECIVRVL